MRETLALAAPSLDFIGASLGELGLERARTRLPDVILLDINLTGMDGFEVIERLKSSPQTRHIPVVAVTAAATETDKTRRKAAGFVSYLIKPIPAQELLRAIQKAMQQPAAPAAPRGGKVLVVDDSPRNLTVASKQLEKLGVAFEVTDDPMQALEKLKAGDFSLALVDIGMPVMNGIQLDLLP